MGTRNEAVVAETFDFTELGFVVAFTHDLTVLCWECGDAGEHGGKEKETMHTWIVWRC
jgi:hypothetical protein